MNFPFGYEIFTGYYYKKPAFTGDFWEILEYDKETLLVVQDKLFEKWRDNRLLDGYMYGEFCYLDDRFYFIKSNFEYLLRPVNKALKYIDDNDALSFYLALKNTRTKLGDQISLYDGLFLELYSLILPVFSDEKFVDDEIVLGSFVTNGVNISINETSRVLELSGISKETLLKISNVDLLEPKNQNCEAFELPGRPELEGFFNEHIIDIVNNQERYKALGIDHPSAIIMHGPPGTGKTYAAEKLAQFLDWPVFRVEASSVASPYIHETSKKIADVFENALKNAPSMLIIDEMEAFLTNRDVANHGHNIEEMAEFLRRIPEATANGVLIIAMTNKLDMIDPAILRRGRFDHIINVDFASFEEVSEMIRASLLKIATEDDINVDKFAKKLADRPLSDIAFFIKESARVAAKNGKDRLDNESMEITLAQILDEREDKSSNKIGFKV